MASNVVWGIDIGKYALKAVKMQREKDETEILEIEYIPYKLKNDKEESIQEAMAEAIAEFVEIHPVKGESVAVALPGRSAFSRVIKLPPVDPKKMEDIVRYEAQQQIPFPIDDVEWAYHRVDKEYEPGEENEVAIFAVKKDLVQGYLADLAVNDIDPDVMTISPLALYNFVQFDMDLGDQATILIDIGADHTDLVIVDENKFWIRNLPIAARDFTARIKKKLKISYPDAEKLKGKLKKSKQGPKVLKILKTLYQDLVDETHRSMGFYKSQAADSKFEKILLAGSGGKVHGLRKYMQKELRLPVQKISRLSRTNIDPYVDVEILKEHIESFGIAIGLAIQGLGESATNVNILPKDKLKAKEEVKKRPYLIGACAVLLVMIVISSMVKSNVLSKVKEVKSNLTSPKLGGTPTAHQKKMAKQCDSEKNVANIQKALQGMLEIGRHRTRPLKVLKALDKSFQKNDFNLKSIRPTPQQEPRIGKDTGLVKVLERIIRNPQHMWAFEITYNNGFNYETQKGNAEVGVVGAIPFQGSEIQSKSKAETQLYQAVQTEFADLIPSKVSNATEYNKLFRVRVPAQPKRYALFDNEMTRKSKDSDITHMVTYFMFNLNFTLPQGDPIVKVDKQEQPKANPRARGRTRGRRNNRRRRR